MSIDPPRSCGLVSKAGVHMYASGIMNSLTRAFKSYQKSENFTGNEDKARELVAKDFLICDAAIDFDLWNIF